MSRRPLIGLTTYRGPASWRRWQGVDAALLPAAYLDALSAGGATTVLIPPLGPADAAADVLGRLDGLVVTGGADVNPARYGEHPHPRTQAPSDVRDVSELALITAAEDIDLPLLGVCRGMQVMAVAAGGRLAQHVPDIVGHERHCPAVDKYGAIEVHIDAGSRLGRIFGRSHVATCHHHQSVAEHPGYRAVASADDGLLEAFELPGERFALGVQWHPEAGNDRALFQAFADAARAYAASSRRVHAFTTDASGASDGKRREPDAPAVRG